MPASRMVTLKNIAAKSGYSLATVGYILRNPQDPRFTESTRAKVVETAKRLRYRPNTAARSMKKRSTGCVAMVINHQRGKNSSRNVVGFEYLLGAHEALAERGQHLLVVTVEELAQKRDQPPLIFREHIVDGLIVEHGVPQDIRDTVEVSNIPVIWLNTDAKTEFNCVYPDEHAGVEAAFAYLYGCGYRTIDFTGASSSAHRHPSAQARTNAYLVCREKYKTMGSIIQDGTEAGISSTIEKYRAYLQREAGPKRVLLTYDVRNASYISLLCANLGIKIPEQLAVFSLDSSPALEGSWRFISSVGFDRQEMGSVAAFMLLDLLDDPSLTPIPSFVASSTVFPGSSIELRV